MAYTINLTDGTIFATIADGTINTSSSMVLVGKNYAGYGQFLDDNFIRLLENGANSTAPSAPLTGQLWWDKTNSVMKAYNGTTFKTISSATASSTQPTSNVAGDLWFDTTSQQLKAYNGSTFIIIGPASTSAQGTSGAIVATVTDNTASDHVVVEFFVANVIVATVSKDSTFTPASAITGFSTIGPGMQLSSTVTNAQFRGTSTNTSALDGLASTQFLRSDTNSTTTGTLGVLNDSGLTVGLDQDAKISVNTVTSAVTLQNQTQNANLLVNVNAGGVSTTALQVVGTSGQVNIPTTISVTGNVSTGGYFLGNGSLLTGIPGGTLISNGTSNVSVPSSGSNVTVNIAGTSNVAVFNTAGMVATTVSVVNIEHTGTNAVGNIGSSSNYFNRLYATATTALYADVAERFEADEMLEAGTVVELGGDKEITKSRQDLSDTVFGVISTRAAYLMNGGAGNDDTHPPVAMTGRVPVKVVGVVNKGDRLVSAGEGFARSAKPGEATSFNVIGRALVSKSDTSTGVVEAIVTIK